MEWVVLSDDAGQWFWRLCDHDGIVARSTVLSSKEECLAQIQRVKAATAAPVVIKA